MQELNATVPLTLLFLDACRSNPFPAGAVLRRDGQALPVRPEGLELTRAMAQDSAAGQAGLGTVIAFAAEPGKAALDGPAGDTSPYAAALLRHLQASAGTEFGTVMRLVTQEVYLKTGGRQRPWVNETLTRLLYFGARPADLQGEEEEILGERRQVLLTIASLDDATRKQVEAAAAAADVPMDALYGLLNALGAQAPKDPAELDAVLRAQTETVKKRLATLQALGRQDAEVARLSALADRALADGAIQANLRFMQAADARQRIVDGSLDETEEGLKASRLASGATKAKLAEAYALNFDFSQAAASYEQAFLQVEKWDLDWAFDYKFRAAGALQDHGDRKGDNEALEQSIAAYGQALALAPRERAPEDWAMTQNNLGAALKILGERESGPERLEQAVQAYRAALEESTREKVPFAWATTQNNLGNALRALGERESGPERLEQAVKAYRAALEELTQAKVPLDWATGQNNLGIALRALGELESDPERLEQAVAAFGAALEERTRDKVPLDWAMTQNNLGNALRSLGERESDPERLEQAVAAFGAALEERTRDKVPLDWAMTQNNLGLALQTLGERESDPERLEQAVQAYRAALEELTREKVPLDWAMTQNNLGFALKLLGERRRDAVLVHEGREAVQVAWDAIRESDSGYDAYFTERLAAFDELLARLEAKD
jgi:uncharacterized caspase-like protein